MKKTIRFIVNPISGVGKQKLVEKRLAEYLDPALFESEIVYTKAKGHATQLAAEAVSLGVDIVVAVGGDGSVNETARALIGTGTALGILPCGSGNGFARHLGIPVNLAGAIRLLNEHRIKLVDAWELNNEFFLNVAGTGFDAHITQVFANHGKRGFSTYAKLILNEFSNYKPRPYSILLDDDQRVETEAFLISIANGSQYGNNAYVSRKALVTDGLVEICILKKFPLRAVPGIALKMFTHSLSSSKYTLNYSSRVVNITQGDTHMHIDGDPIQPGKEIKISCRPLSLNVVVPGNRIL